jgi:hypothetical protein
VLGVQKKAWLCGSRSWQEAWWLGRRRRDVERQEQASAGRESDGTGAGAARGVRKGGTGAAGARHMAGEGGGASGRENREPRAGGRRRGSICNFSKVEGLLCKALITFKP